MSLKRFVNRFASLISRVPILRKEFWQNLPGELTAVQSHINGSVTVPFIVYLGESSCESLQKSLGGSLSESLLVMNNNF